jgi:hypothetical protein
MRRLQRFLGSPERRISSYAPSHQSECELLESDALIVKTYAPSAPTKPLSLRIGDGSTVVEESRTR